MAESKYQSGKYLGWVILSWALFAVAVIASFILLKSYGVMDTQAGGFGSRGLSEMQFTVVIACAGQTLVSLLLAGGFTVLNGIYEAVVEKKALQPSD